MVKDHKEKSCKDKSYKHKKCKNKCRCCRPRLLIPYVSCVNRLFRDQDAKIRTVLGRLQSPRICPPLQEFTAEDLLYKNYNYNASFSKTLQHDETTGALLATEEYKKLARSMFTSDVQLLASVQQNIGAEFGLVNPSAAFSAVLEGAPQCAFNIPSPPALSSDTAAAEMVEVYAQAVARDVPFNDYSTKATITTLLGNTYLNAPGVINNLLYAPATPATPFTAQTIFRGNAEGCILGPYISQLLLLDVPTSAATSFEQKYTTYDTGSRYEWGVSAAEMISIQNGILMGPDPVIDTPKYIYNGRNLAEAVHNDAVYQYFYQAALILLKLGAPLNPDFPTFANQDPFITDTGVVNLLTAIANVAKLGLKHAWYWKWVKFRRLRPEAMSLWVHNVLNGVVPNSPNYKLSNVVLTNPVVTSEIESINSVWGYPSTYTLPLAFKEGSPAHPSYPAGHSILSGACSSILKMFFVGDTPWTSLNPVMETDTAGDNLMPYGGSDAGMTVGTEINKLAYNVILGRDWAGVHYRTDGYAQLGEQIAMRYMGDILSVCAENNPDNTPPSITFRRFDGTLATVKPTVCC